MITRRFIPYLIFLTMSFMVLSTVFAYPAAAQRRYRNYALQKARDSVSVEEIRAHLSKIKEKRPAVALVLSGGGAKGAAHIGVIDYLDSLGIPVDIVLGTSMGGLVGGMYSLGYSPSEMDSIIRTIDWNMALSDKVPRDYISYSASKYKEKFVLSFPFYYAKQDYLEKRQIETRYAGAEKKFEKIGFGAGKSDATSIVKDNLLQSLPSGFAFGQNVNNILSSFSVGYQDNISFLDLPVPFVCVATELISAKPKIWYEGKLTTAMRSTMSIPGVFAPVKTDGMVLVDGGMRNNYPTDLAAQVGADIIIGVDLAPESRDYADINNLSDIISQGVDMLGRASYEQNVKIPDVTIKPKLDEYTMMSFDKKSIDIIIDRGKKAAMEQAAELNAVRELTGKCEKVIYNKKAVDLNSDPVRVSKIEITGVSDKESRYLMGKIRIRPDKPLGKGEIESAVATIFGTQAFDYVTYELLGKEEPYQLLIHCKKGPVHQFGVGGRFDSEEIVSVLINFGLNVHKLQGSRLDFIGKVGTNPYARLHYYFDGAAGPTLNASFFLKWVDRNKFQLGTSDYNVAYMNVREEVYFSNIRWRNFDFNLGGRSDYYRLSNVMANSVTGPYDIGELNNNYLSFFGRMNADTFDDGYFPTKGFKASAGYEWVFAGLRGKVSPLHIFDFELMGAVSRGIFTFMPTLRGRFVSGDEIPLPYINVMGGSFRGRYLDQQMPFAGVNYAVTMPNYLTVLRTDFRFRILKNNYITAMANIALGGSEDSTLSDVDTFYGMIGAGLKYSFNSVIGPIELDVHWRSRNNKTGAYFNIGMYF